MSGKKYLVYKHTNKVNGLVYIGITCQKPEKRWRNGYGYRPAKDEDGNEKSLRFWDAIQEYGWDGFDHLILVRGLTKDEAEWLEIQLIAAYDSTDCEKGYNMTKGGKGTSGCNHTEEWKQNHSNMMKGENHPMYGKTHTKEAKQKMSKNHADIKGKNNPFYGKTHSEETRIKMSENHADMKGKNNSRSIIVICTTTGQVFYGLSEAERISGVGRRNIKSVCEGDRKHAGKLPDGTKLKWKYIKDLPKPQVPEDIKQLLRNGPKPLKIVC